MAIVYIPAQMRELTGGLTSIDIDEPSVRKIIAALDVISGHCGPANLSRRHCTGHRRIDRRGG